MGHYSQATPWNDDASFTQILDRVTNSAKWPCPVISQGYASIPGTHFLKAAGGEEAQQQCVIHGVVHFSPFRHASGRPLFHAPLTHAQSRSAEVRTTCALRVLISRPCDLAHLASSPRAPRGLAPSPRNASLYGLAHPSHLRALGVIIKFVLKFF